MRLPPRHPLLGLLPLVPAGRLRPSSPTGCCSLGLSPNICPCWAQKGEGGDARLAEGGPDSAALCSGGAAEA